MRPGVVVRGCARDGSVTGSAQPGERGPDERARSPAGNWRWRCTEDMLSASAFQWLRDLTESSNRSGLLTRCGDTLPFILTRGNTMKATEELHDLGQSLWLDNITRDLLTTGTLKRYIDELSVTGLTSNPTIFDHAIKNSTAYDAAIRKKLEEGKSGEDLFFELALEDITRAADLFRPIWEKTNGVDGWVSLEVSPLLAHDTAEHAGRGQGPAPPGGAPQPLHQDPRHEGRSARHRGGDLCRDADQRDPPVLPRALPGGGRGIPARHRAAHRRRAQPRRRLRGLGVHQPLGRRGHGQSAEALNDRLGIAIAERIYKAYRDLLGSPRWQRVYNAGARPQRLLWASTGTKDPKASDVLYIKALAAPFTVNTMPEGTLKAFADHGEIGPMLPADGGDCEDVLAQFAKAGIDIDALAAQLQDEGAKSFVKSWNELMAVIASKSAALANPKATRGVRV